MSDCFHTQGFVKSIGRISSEVIKGARDEFATLSLLRTHDRFLSEETLSQLVFSQQLSEHAVEFAQSLLGLNEAPQIVQSQMVLRPANHPSSMDYHVDGRPLLDNEGNDWNRMPLFDLIVGIPLIAVPAKDHGNLAYLAGAHRKVGRHIYEDWNTYRALNGSGEAFSRIYDFTNTLGRESEEFVCTEPGDMYAMHALMPHRVLRNKGPKRPAWYFRVGIPSLRGREAFSWALENK